MSCTLKTKRRYVEKFLKLKNVVFHRIAESLKKWFEHPLRHLFLSKIIVKGFYYRRKDRTVQGSAIMHFIAENQIEEQEDR